MVHATSSSPNSYKEGVEKRIKESGRYTSSTEQNFNSGVSSAEK
jgi:hypothetical protein